MVTKEQNLANYFPHCLRTIEHHIEIIRKDSSRTGEYLYSLFLVEKDISLYYFFIEQDIKKMKQSMYRGARCIHLAVDKFNAQYNEFGTLLPTLVSDNKDLINHFPELTYGPAIARRSYADDIERGWTTLRYVIQCLMKEDWQEYERVMAILKDKGVKRVGKLITYDIATIEALAERNKQKIEDALSVIVSPRIHYYTKKEPDIIPQFISVKAVCYAKLAWLKGIEVEVDSSLIPKEWLPIQPLKDEEYIDYDFVKAYLG